MIRNLIYHITPMERWRENLNLLNQYSKIFTGVKLAVVAQGAGLEHLKDIQDELGLFDHIWPLPNDPELRETPSLAHLLRALPRYASEKEGVTFFAHTKGVTRGRDAAVKKWTALSYEHNLKDAQAVDDALKTHAVAGCFKRYGNFQVLGPRCPWHFSGTFFWFRNNDLYKRDWQSALTMHRYGAEAFAGILFENHEAFALFEDNCGNPYNFAYINHLG
jgi:hypothetical protein